MPNIPTPNMLRYAVGSTPSNGRVGRRFAGFLLMLLVLPAGFGFLASFEPGTSIWWKIGYASFGLASLVLGVWLFAKKK